MRLDNPLPPTTYLFYDLETSGLSPAFDQILQFAAVRLDQNFEELERHNIRVQLSEDTIPSPQALVVNRTSVAMFHEGVSEYDAIQKIYDLMNTPGTISVGYNSLSFDDEFLRFSFFKHLLPPYRHQYANHCARMDIFPIVLLAFQIRRDLLEWPIKDGKHSFKLEYLARANNCNTGASHDALIDVLDTIALAKLLRQDALFWEEATTFFNKKKDKEIFENNASTFTIGTATHSLSILLEKQPNMPPIPALCLGTHKHYENQTRWLRLDENDFAALPANTLGKQVKSLRKKWGEPPFLFSNHDARLLGQLSPHQIERVEANLRFLQENSALFSALKEEKLNEAYPDNRHYDANAALYKLQFAKKNEEEEKKREQVTEHLCRSFHLLDNSRKHEVVRKLASVNPIYQTLAIRIMGRYMPSRLSPEDRLTYQMYLAHVFYNSTDSLILDHRDQAKLSLPEAMSATEKLLLAAKTPEEQQFLTELKMWYFSRVNQYKMPVMTHGEMGTQTETDCDENASRKRPRDEAVNPAHYDASLFSTAAPNIAMVTRETSLQQPDVKHAMAP
ncbi:MAG: exodeoxyribonuclease I [Coxiellaceae bacterium]|nr:exodeoxyribonuclease I [Coxiellaceae bacterium]